MSSDTLTYDDLDPRDQALIDEAGGGHQTVVSARMVRALNGNGNAAIMLSQLLYWSRHKADEDGWFYRTRSDMEERCGLGKTAQKSAAETLQALGFVETDLRGMPRRKHYRLHLKRIVSALARDEPVRVQAREQDRGDGREQAGGHGREQDRGHGRDPNRKEQREEQGESSGSGRAPARDEPSGDSLPDADVGVQPSLDWLPEQYDIYKAEIRALMRKYDQDAPDQLVRNQWGRSQNFSFHAVAELADEHPWRHFVAGVVVTANEADRPNPRYLASIIDALINPANHERHTSDDPRQHPAENHQRIAAAIDAAFDE